MMIVPKGLLAGLRAFAIAAVAAATCLAHAASARASGATVLVNEVPVVTLRTTLQRKSPTARAAALAVRIRSLPAEFEVAVRPAGAYLEVRGGGAVLIRVGKAEAKAHRSDAWALADQWAERLRSALALPPLQLANDTLKMPVQRTKVVGLVGSAAHKAVLTNSDPRVVSVKRVASGIQITTLRAGEAQVTASFGQASAAIAVQALPFAAPLPQTVDASVVGAPALSGAVKNAATLAVLRRLRTEPDATVTVKAVETRSVPLGKSTTVRAVVSVTAPGAIASEGAVLVKVQNTGERMRREDELWYCNDPESVRTAGNLFAANLRADSTARMLYHHTNASRAGLVIQVVVKNLSPKAAKLVVMPGDGTPHADPVRVGAEAGQRFLESWLVGSGEVVDLPAWSAMPIAVRRLAPGETMSGLCGLRLLDGGPDMLRVRTDAAASADYDPAWLRSSGSPTPWIVTGVRTLAEAERREPVLTRHIYPEPFKTVAASYEVGGKFAFVRLGQKPLSNADESRVLDGNFGVLYTVDATLRNGTAIPAEVEVVFEASAGYSAALFAVDGRVVLTPVLGSKAEYVVRRLKLAPGSATRFILKTVPLSGSSYPATITFRPSNQTLSHLAQMASSSASTDAAPKP